MLRKAMKQLLIVRVLVLLGLVFCLSLSSLPWLTANAEAAITGEDDRFSSYSHAATEAREQLDDGDFDESFTAASAAIKMNDKRWEAYAIAGLALSGLEKYKDAVDFIDKALKRAPQSQQQTLTSMKKKFARKAALQKATGKAQLSREGRENLRVLVKLATDADKAKRQKERLSLLNEFMAKSSSFVQNYPDYKDVWVMRAAASIELNNAEDGREAGKRLKELGLIQNRDPKVRKVISLLKKKGWMG